MADRPAAQANVDITFDIVGILTRLTGKSGWRELRAPNVQQFEVEFSYAIQGEETEARITLDGEAIQITIGGEVIYSGTLQAEELREFVYPTEPSP